MAVAEDISPRGGAASLAITDVTHRYGPILAVDKLSITVGPGEIVCLLGPSGCGKSTLLRVAAGLEPLQAGRISIGGEVVATAQGAVPPEARGVGLVFQDYALFPHLNVLQNVAFGLRPLGRAGEAAGLLERVDMADYAQAYPHELSGGQQQRVALARALAPGPRVNLLDEPFSGLDTRLRNQVRDETLHILKHSGAATLMVTHDPEEAMFMADRLAVMRDGRLEQDGRPPDLYYGPANAFVAELFGEVNRLSGRVAGGRVETPFGPVPAAGMADGAKVEVLVRPEAVKPVDSAAGGADLCQGIVETSRLLGRTSLIHMEIKDKNGGRLHIHARVPGCVLPPQGTSLGLGIEATQVFVFPIIDAT